MSTDGAPTMVWEKIESGTESGLLVHRSKVRGGWIVNVVAGPHMNTVFVPDERHRWVENWDSPEYYLR